MRERQARKVLLIGWDASDWKVIGPLLDAGKMPNLQKFADRGVVGNLSTLYPVLSPMLWTSIATGKRAYKHGIHGFAEPDPVTGGVRPVTSTGRATKAIWNILSQNGLRSNVIGWWPSFPAEPINGVMVANNYQKATGDVDDPWPLPEGTVHPVRLRTVLDELRVHPSEITPEQVLPFVPEAAQVDQDKDRRLWSICKTLAECASVHSAATAVMQNEPWDFMAVYYDAIDHFCHGFMRYHPPRLPWVDERDFRLYRHVVETAYIFHDMMLGTLMHLAGDDATIIIVSDHGFHPDHLRPRELPNEPAGPAEEHRPFGIFAALGPGIRQDELVFGASLLDVTPTILSLFGLPVGRDMDGKVLTTALLSPTIDYVDSWDDIEGEDGRNPEGALAGVVDESEALKQLAELGYIEDPEESGSDAARHTLRELRYNLARDLFGARLYAEAIPIFQELWEEYPEESRFGLKLFDCHLSTGQLQEARATLDRVVERKRLYSAEAREKYEEALETLQKNGRRFEDLDESTLRRLQKLHRNASTNEATLAYLKARLYQNEGRYQDALRELDKAADVQTHNHPSLLQTRGETLMAMARWDQAADTFRQITDMDPANPLALLGLCRCHLARRGEEAQALEAARHSLGLAYHNPRAHFLCGVALQRLGRASEARQALQVAVSQAPMFPAAHRRLARLYRLAFMDQDKANEHIALARAARKRIEAFQAGEYVPSPADSPLDPDSVATLSELDSGSAALPPPPENAILVVSGLPRSGTSMMMQMLEAGGIPLFTDQARRPDESNPRGYYEHEAIKKMASDTSWVIPARGKAVKIVAPLLPRLQPGEHYRIIFMERTLRCVLASQDNMLQRMGRKGSRLSPHRLAETYIRQVESARRILSTLEPRPEVLVINYEQALADPSGTAARINRFLGGGLDETAMRTAVDPELRHQ